MSLLSVSSHNFTPGTGHQLTAVLFSQAYIDKVQANIAYIELFDDTKLSRVI